MEDSTENMTEDQLHGENEVVANRPIFLPIFNSLLQVIMAVLRFLASYAHRPISSSPEDSYTNRSYQPPTVVDPPIDESEQEESEFSRSTPPPPPPSNGGGGQTH